MVAIDVLTLLGAATVGLVAGRRLRLPPIVVYLLVGLLVGPAGFRLVRSSEAIEQLAELGIALLLFGVGIELSPAALRRGLARLVLAGGAQVALTVVLTTTLLSAFGMATRPALLVGFLVSLSSTAILFKLHEDAGDLDAPHGRVSAGVLLFQDLILVPMILLVPALAAPAGRAALGAAATGLLTATLALGALLLLARAVLPRTLAMVARAGVAELFPLTSVVVALGTALLAEHLGLSLPVGAFLAGLALSGSPYSHQVFGELLPLRDVFVALFFTSVGMLIEPWSLVAQAQLSVLLLGAVVAKGVATGLVVTVLWRSPRLGVRSGIALAQIGELSFVLAQAGVRQGVLLPETEQAFLAVAVVTMALTPLLVRVGAWAAQLGAGAAAPVVDKGPAEHVVVVGYGSTGSAVARVMRETGLPFVVVEMLAEAVENAARDHMPLVFGDASLRAVLDHAGVSRARVVVVTVGEPWATRRIVSLVRQLGSGARIIVRARAVLEIDELEQLGADEVVASELEASVELFVRTLVHLGVPRHIVRLQESIVRAERYRALRGFGTTAELITKTQHLIEAGVIETAMVLEGSPLAGRTLAETDLMRRTGAIALSLVRGGVPQPVPSADTRLEVDDLVVLFGAHEAVDRALDLFERPAAGVDPSMEGARSIPRP
jgi:CPA2 family monovalent cation:H+ antiporter-2